MSIQDKVAWFGGVTGLLSAIFTGCILLVTYKEHKALEKQRRSEIERIKYDVVIENSQGAAGGGKLRVVQISGTPTIIHGIELAPSIEAKSGKPLTAEPFNLPLQVGTIENGMPSFEIDDIGIQICHRRRHFGGVSCDPSFRFELRYQFEIDGEGQGYRPARYKDG